MIIAEHGHPDIYPVAHGGNGPLPLQPQNIQQWPVGQTAPRPGSGRRAGSGHEKTAPVSRRGFHG